MMQSALPARGTVITALAIPTVGLLIGTFFLATFGFAQFETTLSLLNKDNLKLGDNTNFLIFAYVGFVLMLVQGVIYRKMAHRLNQLLTGLPP